jgi:integrase/recombinase XerD
MSALAERLNEYLALRRSLGFKLERPGQLLAQFVAYLEQAEVDTVTTERAVAWARQPTTARQFWWSHRLSTVRGFARYLHATDPRHEVPPRDLLPAGRRRAEPYIYAPAEIANLLRAATRITHPLMSATYATYIGLLAVTGMRAGEAIALDRDDLDWSQGLLVVRNAKFGKAREVVLHPTTVRALRDYDGCRRRLLPEPRTPAFFVSTAGTRLIYSNVQHTFHELTKRAGMQPRSEHCRPRLHDLRHTFAVNTLLGWYRAGTDVAERMHLLTTYLGHGQPADTYWYLSATPELLALIGQRLERQLEGLA